MLDVRDFGLKKQVICHHPSFSLGSIGLSKRQTVPGKPDAKKSWDQFEKYGSLSLHYVKQVSGKRKDHRLEKYKSNLNISEVPTP